MMAGWKGLNIAMWRQSRWRVTGWLFLLAAVWLVLRGYRGIDHDALLYTAEALHVLHPEIFARDLFFAFGSQGDFTLFPTIYAFFIKLMGGIEPAAFWLTLAGKIMWAAAAWALCRSLTNGAVVLLTALLLLVLGDPYYDVYGIFSLAEPFVTPRIFAEAACMAALAAYGRQHLIAALAFLCIGGVLHPLMTLPCGLTLMLWIYAEQPPLRKPLIAIGLVGMGVALTAAFLGIAPFNGLFTFFDAQWWAVQQRRSPFLLFWMQEGGYAGRVIYLVAVLILGGVWLQGRLQTLSRAMVVTVVLSLLVWWLGAAHFQHVLAVQLQVWRCFWLLQVLVCLTMAAMVPCLWRRGFAGKVLLILMFSGFFVPDWGGIVFLLIGIFACWWIPKQPARARSGLIWLVVCGLAIVVAILQHEVELTANANVQSIRRPLGWEGYMLAFWIVSGLAAAWLASPQLWCVRIGGCLATVALLLGGVVWSAVYLTPTPIVENAGLKALRAKIPEGAVVASNIGPEWVWTRLMRANYGGFLVMTVSAFNQKMAIEGWRRLELLHQVGMPDAKLDWREESASVTSEHRLGQDDVDLLCEDVQLDYLVLKGAMPMAETFDVPAYGVVSVFDCAVLRAARGKI
jgi:hypothetical protein